jgi:DNA-directed RNA polymerase subunit RPC12/RpoP
VKFRLKVRKYKCSFCDTIFLVEYNQNWQPNVDCPRCTDDEDIEYMGDINIVQEDDE